MHVDRRHLLIQWWFLCCADEITADDLTASQIKRIKNYLLRVLSIHDENRTEPNDGTTPGPLVDSTEKSQVAASTDPPAETTTKYEFGMSDLLRKFTKGEWVGWSFY